MNRCKYRPELVAFCTIVVENRAVITRIWNQVRNFGTGSGYPVSDYKSLTAAAVIIIPRIYSDKHTQCTVTACTPDSSNTRWSYEATSGRASSISRLTFVLSATSASLMSTQRILDAALCSAGRRQLLLTISSSSSRTAAFNSGSVSKSYMHNRHMSVDMMDLSSSYCTITTDVSA